MQQPPPPPQQQQQQKYATSFDATRSSGIWEGLSFKGRDSDATLQQGNIHLDDETRWSDTSLVFTDPSTAKHHHHHGSRISKNRDEPPPPRGSVALLSGKGVSHWRGRAIPFEVRGYVTTELQQAVGIASLGNNSKVVHKITLIKRHLGAFSNVVQYEGTSAKSMCCFRPGLD